MFYGLSVINAWPAKFILEMAKAADEAEWDGFFLWDHLTFDFDVDTEDPWVVLGAIATRTKRMRIGTLVTALPRRRPHKVAKETATLDHLSRGRGVLGVGLGGVEREFSAFGEDADAKVRAERLDEALKVITGLWSGKVVEHHGRHYTVNKVAFTPKPVQKPRIPIWVGGRSKGALRRASRYDGWVPEGPAPSANSQGLSTEDVRRAVQKIKKLRGGKGPFDVVYGTELPEDKLLLGETVQRAQAAGATWLLEGIYGLRYTREGALERVKKGPPKRI